MWYKESGSQNRQKFHIRFLDVSKRYHLKENLLSKKNTFWALEDLSFDIERSETVGIIGPNGAGKTTVMKIIARITVPTKGEAVVTGSVVPLIGISRGFYLRLTARETIIYLSSIYGLRGRFLRGIFNEIVKFAEIENFLDMPIMRYSAGMSARLGFSIALHIHTDIILIDEVFMAADEEFQNKCIEKILGFQKKGRTILICSHNLDIIERLCNKVIWMAKGKKILEGDTKNVIQQYRHSLNQIVAS